MDTNMKQILIEDPLNETNKEILDDVKSCIERNSFIAMITCLISAIFVYLIAKFVTLDPLDAGLIIHEKAFNVSSNMTQKIRTIMSVA
jgi:hypothetical protein